MSRIRDHLTGIVFVVALVVVSGILWYTGVLADTWDGIRGADPIPLVFVVLLGMTAPLIHAWRWQIIMRALDAEFSLGEACEISVSAALLNYSSPGFIGVSTKALLANQTRSAPISTSALAIGFEFALDLALMATSATIVILIIGPSAFSQAVEPLRGIATAGVALVVIAVIAVAAVIAWRLGALRYLRSKTAAVRQVGAGVNRLAVAGLTVAYLLIQIIVTVLMFMALDIPVGMMDVLAIATIPGIASMLAPIPGGVGVREAVTVALSTVTDISAVKLVTLALVQRVLLVLALPLSLILVRLARKVAAAYGSETS